MPEMVIRGATPGDAEWIARLASQLGYPSETTTVARRLARIVGHPDHALFVAEEAGAGLVGWIHAFMVQLVESKYRAEIGGLVVDERHHRKGVGSRLVMAVEEWAAARGAEEISVRCQIKRLEAHAFYERLGFEPVKTQFAFRKPLPKSG